MSPAARVRKPAVIVNPNSAGGRTGKRWPEIERQLRRNLGSVTACLTQRSGHAIELTRELLAQGFDLIIGLGGDGTFNEIANGFIDRDELVRPGACMGLLPAGTGGDFRRMFGFSSRGDIQEALEVLASGEPIMIDVGKVRYTSPKGAPAERYFVNLVSFGMGGAVAAGARNFMTSLGGRVAFFWSTFRVLLAYRGKCVRLCVDDGAPAEFRVTNVAVGNGRFHGGGMLPCPAARMDDGVLEVTVIEYMDMLRLLRDIRVLYSGEIYRHPKVHRMSGARVNASSGGETLIEVDGEALGKLPIEITILPARLPVLACAARSQLGVYWPQSRDNAL